MATVILNLYRSSTVMLMTLAVTVIALFDSHSDTSDDDILLDAPPDDYEPDFYPLDIDYDGVPQFLVQIAEEPVNERVHPDGPYSAAWARLGPVPAHVVLPAGYQNIDPGRILPLRHLLGELRAFEAKRAGGPFTYSQRLYEDKLRLVIQSEINADLGMDDHSDIENPNDVNDANMREDDDEDVDVEGDDEDVDVEVDDEDDDVEDDDEDDDVEDDDEDDDVEDDDEDDDVEDDDEDDDDDTEQGSGMEEDILVDVDRLEELPVVDAPVLMAAEVGQPIPNPIIDPNVNVNLIENAEFLDENSGYDDDNDVDDYDEEDSDSSDSDRDE